MLRGVSKYVLKSEVRRKAYVQFTDVKDTFGSTIFKWFIPVECDYNIKYKNDIRWVSQNTTLYYGVRCQKIDNMFRPFSIRPSSRSDMVD